LNDKILQTLNSLESQSRLEKTRQVSVKSEDRMCAITKDTGKFFNLILKTMNAKKILEIGTSTGYSTLWFADAILSNHNKGKIITIEKNTSKIKRAKNNFKTAGILNLVEMRQGEAKVQLQEIVKQVNNNEEQKFDFIFIDADKENVKEYFDLSLTVIKIGGIIATDNILYPEKFSEIMKNFTNYVKSKTNVETVTIPIGNGEEISIRIS